MGSYVVKYDDLINISKEMFMGLGYSESQASTVARCLVEADARHFHSHGTAAMATYATHIKVGNLKLDAPAPTTVFETPISIVMDGHSGVGFSIAEVATKKCIEKAKKSGICIAAVRQANHYGFAGNWPEMMASEGLIGMTMTNTIRCVCPTRSAERSLGTNPIAVAFPVSGDEPMFLMDMATCVIPNGKIVRSQYFADAGVVPSDVVIDGDGKVVTDFKKVLEILQKGDDRSHIPNPKTGGLLPLGGSTETLSGHKGFCLAMLVELLTGGLSGGTPSKFLPFASEGICFFFMAIDPALFGEPKAVKEHVKYIIDEYRKTVPIDPDNPVIMPGDKERAFREQAMTEGVELSTQIVDSLRGVATTTGKTKELEAVLVEKK